ncbi:MAG: beta-N-acetylhexosaminidase [Rhizobiaceae bacterium]
MRIKSFISGCATTSLTPEEKHFFQDENPWGYILFARNIETPEQVLALTNEMRSISGRQDVPILIDQEGGRVQRLRPPNWPSFPPAGTLGEIYKENPDSGNRAAWLQSRLMAVELQAIGVNIDCLPVLDVHFEDCSDVVGDRAFSSDPHEVAQMARSACEGLLAGGVLPVIKHMPGHGRAKADSHHQLPVVDTETAELGCTDFYPFMQLADMPIGITAHVVYSAIDSQNPATTSSKVIGEIIRGWLGFDGLLLTDDLSMNALSGDFGQRAQSAFAGGCDIVLHCNGNMEEMKAVAEVTPELTGKAEARARLALGKISSPVECDEKQLRAEFGSLTGATV